MVSDNEMVAGASTVTVSVNINLDQSAGNFHGSFVLEPFAYEDQGTWEANFAGHFKGAKFEGNPLTHVDAVMIAQGTGILQGKILWFNHMVNPAFDHPADPDGAGSCNWVGELWSGIILERNN